MTALHRLQFPTTVSDTLDFCPLPRFDRACAAFLNRDHLLLPRNSLPDGFVSAFSDTAFPFSSFPSFEPVHRFDLKLAVARSRASSSAARDKRSGSQNHLVNEGLRRNVAASQQQAAPGLQSDEESRSSQVRLGNAGQAALSGCVDEETLLREARYRAMHHGALNSDAEEWKSMAGGTATQRTLPQVRNRQLMKIAQLRHNKDAQEGAFTHIQKRAGHRQKQPVFNHNQKGENSKATSQTATRSSWTLADVKCLPAISNSFWWNVGITILVAGTLFIMIQLFSSMEGLSRRHSVKRRIIRSQWYGNSGPQKLSHRDVQVRRTEFLRYPILEVDGDKKTFRFPSHARKPYHEGSDHWASETKVNEPLHGQSVVSDTRSDYGKELFTSQFTPKKKVQPPWSERASSAPESIAPAEHKPMGRPRSHVSMGEESELVLPQHKLISEDDEVSATGNPMRWSITGGSSRREKLTETPDMKEEPVQRLVMEDISLAKTDGKRDWQEEDELDLDRRVRKLRHTVQAVEQHRRAALLALAEERQRSMELEEEISKQRETSTALVKEVQLLKESHDALLTLLRKKYSSSAAARAAADLIYQDWESDDGQNVHEAVAK